MTKKQRGLLILGILFVLSQIWILGKVLWPHYEQYEKLKAEYQRNQDVLNRLASLSKKVQKFSQQKEVIQKNKNFLRLYSHSSTLSQIKIFLHQLGKKEKIHFYPKELSSKEEEGVIQVYAFQIVADLDFSQFKRLIWELETSPYLILVRKLLLIPFRETQKGGYQENEAEMEARSWKKRALRLTMVLEVYLLDPSFKG